MMTSFLPLYRILQLSSVTLVLLGYLLLQADCSVARGVDVPKEKLHDVKRDDGKPVMASILTGSLQHRQVIATGYTAGVESTGKKPGHPEYGITFSGVKVRRGLVSTIAADPKVFPIGTVLYVPDYGYGIVADTGSAIKGNKIDLYFETRKQVFKQWGKRKVTVYVLKRGNGKLTEAWLSELVKATNSSKTLPQKLLEM